MSYALQLIAPIVPVLVVTLSACAVLLAESFRPAKDDCRCRIRLASRLIGLIGAIAASVLLWDRHLLGFGVIVVDNYTIFFNITICGDRAADDSALVGIGGARRAAARRVLRADAVLDGRA